MKLVIKIFMLLFLSPSITLAEQPDETTIDWKSTEEIGSLIKIKLYPTKGEVTYGPNFAYSDKSLLDNYSEIYLTRVVDPENEESYTLFLTTHHNDEDWRAYDSVHKKDGTELKFVTIATNKDVTDNNVSYKYEEKLAIKMSFIDVADAFSSGMLLTINGSQPSKLLIPGSYFLAMLQSL